MTVFLVAMDFTVGSVRKGNYQLIQKSAVCATRELALAWWAENYPKDEPPMSEADIEDWITEYTVITSEDQLR